MNDDNDNEINKKKKLKRSSEQIAIETEEKEAHFEKMIEEHKKILELTQREYTNIVQNAERKLIKSKKEIILEAGRYLENNLEIVKNNSPDQICRILKQKFKGLINPSTIWYVSPEKWKSQGYANTGRIGGLETQKRLKNSSVSKEEPLTEYEQKYVELHEQKVYHNENMQALIDYYLGMTEEEKTIIFGKVKRKGGSEFHNALIDEAYNNMLRIVKSLNDADIPALLADIRFLKTILTKVADMALNEHEQRKRNKEMMKE